VKPQVSTAEHVPEQRVGFGARSVQPVAKSAMERLEAGMKSIIGSIAPRGAALLLSILLPACSKPGRKAPEGPMTISLSSTAFAANGSIPAVHTCDGRDLSPPLAWSGVPAEAKSLALIVDDPDAPDPRAPKTTWVHWALYDIPPSASGLEAGASQGGLPAGTRQGKNDWKRTGYGGPCPPIGRHRYFFKLFALGTTLPDLNHPTKAELEKAMEGHILAHTEMIGLYQKTR
jgi:Raf kinase inhibitor-like YbhB/YbcL family protein